MSTPALRILYDTNVLLDVLLRREPHVRASAQLWDAAHRGRIAGVVSAISVPTISYLVGRAYSAGQARSDVRAVLASFEVAPVGRPELEAGLEEGFARDYEDGVVCASAARCGCGGIVTRDAKGFAGGELPVYTPDELLAVLSTAGS
jgi:predicted nucleic acid-binding protein